MTRRVRLDRIRIEQELTFKEAAEALGRKRDPEGRKLRNLVQNREKQTGRQIAIPMGGEGREAKITLSALYRAFPEMRPVRVDYLAAGLRELLERVDEHTELVVQRVIEKIVEPRVELVEKKVKLLEKQMGAAQAFLRSLAENQLDSTEHDRKRPTG